MRDPPKALMTTSVAPSPRVSILVVRRRNYPSELLPVAVPVPTPLGVSTGGARYIAIDQGLSHLDLGGR